MRKAVCGGFESRIPLLPSLCLIQKYFFSFLLTFKNICAIIRPVNDEPPT